MAGGFLPKLLGRASPPPHEVEHALTGLTRLAGERPAFAGPANLLADILPRLYESPLAEAPPPLTRDHAAAKLAGGIPLLRGENWQPDLKAFARRWQAVCEASFKLAPKTDGAAAALATALRKGRLDAAELIRDVLAGRPEEIHARADRLGLDAGLTALVLRLTLLPALACVNESFAALRDGTCWEAGYCPTCGSWPLLGEFRGLDQTRFLRCGLCAAAWEFPRLACPFCGNREHQQLGYLHVEGEEARHRAATCESCHGYVKMVATLTAPSPPQLLVTDLATLHLDLAAAERGYLNPP